MVNYLTRDNGNSERDRRSSELKDVSPTFPLILSINEVEAAVYEGSDLTIEFACKLFGPLNLGAASIERMQH